MSGLPWGLAWGGPDSLGQGQEGHQEPSRELLWCFPRVSPAPFPLTFSSRASLTSRHLGQGFSGTVVFTASLM